MEKKEFEAKYSLSTRILEAEQTGKQQLMNQCLEYDQRIAVLEAQVSIAMHSLVEASMYH